MKTLFRLFPVTVLLALLPLGFLAVMVVAPLVAMAAYDGSAWSLVLADDYMQHRLVWTVVQAAVTCVLVLLLGIPVGWSLARCVGFVRGKRCVVGGLAGYAVFVALRQCVFQLACVGARGVSGFFAGAAGAVAVGADAGCGGLAAVLFCGMAGVASLVGRWGLFGIFVLFFGFRTGFAAGWQPLYDG